MQPLFFTTFLRHFTIFVVLLLSASSIEFKLAVSAQHKAYDCGNGDNKQRRKDKASNNKRQGITFLEVPLTVFVTLNTDRGGKNTFHQGAYVGFLFLWCILDYCLFFAHDFFFLTCRKCNFSGRPFYGFSHIFYMPRAICACL